MSAFLGNIAFLNPWLLLGLTALPALWFLLRVMPPAPRLIAFPAVRFLAGLIPEQQTPSHTPWWILLLRLLIAALVILALSHPVHNPAKDLESSGAIRLVIDNGWAAAQNWDAEMRAGEEILTQAERDGRDIFILTTAPQAGEDAPLSKGPLNAAQAKSIIKALAPLPWPADYAGAIDALNEQTSNTDIESIWLGHGLDEGGAHKLARALHDQGGLRYVSPKPEQLPLLVTPSKSANATLAINIVAINDTPTRVATVQAATKSGRALDQKTATLAAGKSPTHVEFDIPAALSKDAAQITLAGQTGAGGVFILNESFRGRSVGIVGPSDVADIKPFIEDIYYLKRALEPYSEITIGAIEDVIEQSPSLIILPDIIAIPAQTLNNLEQWVSEGGLLLRFAGPKTAEGNDQTSLLPVPLRSGARSTEGSLSWESPPKLTSFSKDSPFYGIALRDDITVRQQILPQIPMGEDGATTEKIWAALDDGTPLITANAHNKGMLVMVHTTASVEWSDFALSGAYVEILKRLLGMSGRGEINQSATNEFLHPLWVLDGMGHIKKPERWVEPIATNDLTNTPPDAKHPPGIYGHNGLEQTINIGAHVGTLTAMTDLPTGAIKTLYGDDYEFDLMPALLFAALLLLLLDWLIMIIFMSSARLFGRAIALIIIMLSCTTPAHANDDIKYADGLYLAYVQTGDPALDRTSKAGLENLAQALAQRTSAEPVGVAALDPQRDTLAFFPLIYWPISAAQKPLSESAIHNIQYYLDHGGTILLDTRDQNISTNQMGTTPNAQALRRTLGVLNIPPLTPITKDHVLGRSFYLLDAFPGRFTGGTIWVEDTSGSGRDGVSSVIIGAHDWAGAWAMDNQGRSMLAGGARQQELARRFGVNLALYALTGNYKADQVHIPHILERLGR